MKPTQTSSFRWPTAACGLGLLGLFTISTLSETVAESSQPIVEMIVPGGNAARYWPRWRGPSGQGWATGSSYPDRWSETENILWKAAVPGRGHSSPIVWGDKIFLTAASDDGAQRSVLCYRRSDGQQLWRTHISVPVSERLYRKNSYASSTVSTDGERIYAYFGNGGLAALDFEGRIVWRKDLGEINLYHGPAGTPLLWEDRLILHQEQRTMSRSDPGDPGFIVAVDKLTGRQLWRKSRSPRAGWGSPVAVRVGDRVEIIVSSGHRIDAYDPYTGEILWYAEGNKFETIPTPVVGHGLVYCSSGRAGPTIAVRPGGQGDVTDTRVVWKTAKGSPFVPSPLLLGDYLYTVNDMVSVATGHDAKTGRPVGQLRLGEAVREGFSASPVAVDGKIFFTNDEGETFVLNPAPDFKLLHVNRLGERTLASPALVDGRWYFRTVRHLIAIGKE